MKALRLRASLESSTDAIERAMLDAVKQLERLGMPKGRASKIGIIGHDSGPYVSRTLTTDEIKECVEILTKLTPLVAGMDAHMVSFPYWDSYDWAGGDSSVEDVLGYETIMDYMSQDTYTEDSEYDTIHFGLIEFYKSVIRLINSSSTSSKSSNESALEVVGLGVGAIVIAATGLGIGKLAKKGIDAMFAALGKAIQSSDKDKSSKEDDSIPRWIERLERVDGKYAKPEGSRVEGKWVSDLTFNGKFDTDNPMASIRAVGKAIPRYEAFVKEHVVLANKVHGVMDTLDRRIKSAGWEPSTEGLVEWHPDSMQDMEDHMALRDLIEEDREVGIAIEHLGTLYRNQQDLLQIQSMVQTQTSIEDLRVCGSVLEAISSSYGIDTLVPSYESQAVAQVVTTASVESLLRKTRDGIMALLRKILEWIKGLFGRNKEVEKTSEELADAVAEALPDLTGDYVVKLGLDPRNLGARHTELVRASDAIVRHVVATRSTPTDESDTSKAAEKLVGDIGDYRKALEGEQSVNAAGIKEYSNVCTAIVKSSKDIRKEAESLFTKVERRIRTAEDDELQGDPIDLINAARKAVSQLTMVNAYSVQRINRAIKPHLKVD